MPALDGARLALVGRRTREGSSWASRAARRAQQLVRAALEAIAHQVADVVDALPLRPTALRADGGASANGFLMQHQADLLGIPVEVAADPETTALGAAALASRTRAESAHRRPLRAAAVRPTRSRCRRQAWNDAVNRTRS